MGMLAILSSDAEPFEHIVNKPYVKSGENWSNGFREVDIKRLHNYIHIHSPAWARADNPWGKNFNCNWNILLLYSYMVSFSLKCLIHF